MWERDVETSSQDPVKRHVGSKEVNKLVDEDNECDKRDGDAHTLVEKVFDGFLSPQKINATFDIL